MKKCPKGVICVENITLIILFIITLIIVYLFYIQYNNNNNTNKHSANNIIVDVNTTGMGSEMGPDVLLNPYTPPLRNDRYPNSIPSYGIPSYGMGVSLPPPPQYGIRPGFVPVNVSTNIGAVDTSYRQVGILTPLNSLDDTLTNKILPLMGRPLFTNRDKWQFYTTTKNNIKLPVSRNGQSGTSEYGCDNIYDGDTIHVKGYNSAFKATVYDNDTIRYIPSV
jgi:hypothetical protein